MVIFYRRLITNPRKGRYVSSVHNLVNDFWCGCLMLNKASMHKMFVDVQYYFYSCHHYPSNKARAVRAGEAGVPHKDLSPEVCQGNQEGREGPGYQCSSFANAASNFLCESKASLAPFFLLFSFSYSRCVVCVFMGLPPCPGYCRGRNTIYICLKKKRKKEENPA